MDIHVNEVSRACIYHLRALRHIRSAITTEDANMIACSVVGARLDYANSVLYGVSKKNINCLQRIQNALARCVVDSKIYHISSNASLQQLHWLPIDYRINLKSLSSRFSHAHLSPAHISTRRSIVTCRSARSVLRMHASLLFLAQTQSLARVLSVSLGRPFLIRYLMIFAHVTMFLLFVAV